MPASAVGKTRLLEGVHVLVVEDDADLRESVVEGLRLEGARVSIATSGNAGFDAFIRERPDVIVSNVLMPDGTGYDMIMRVRGLPPEQGGLVPAIALSGSESMRSALMAGFHVFLPKPFDPFKLVDAVADFAKGDGRQPVAPWTISESQPGKLLLTLVGRVESGDMRAMAAALLVHLERGGVEIVADLRRLTSFAPSVASVGERALWHHRRQIRAMRFVGGSLAARLVSAAACKVLGISCTFSDRIENNARAEP
jgi:CheY-like chemotaxis protein